MKNLLFLFSLIILLSCNQENNKTVEKEEMIIKAVKEKQDIENVNISGRLLNFDQSLKGSYLRFCIYNLGKFDFTETPCTINDNGTFEMNLTIDSPQEIDIRYNSNLKVLIYPGDSIYIEFDALKTNESQLLQNVSFSGDRAELNKQLSTYLRDFYKIRPSANEMRLKLRELSPQEFVKFQDNLKKELNYQRNLFLSEIQPSEELEIWTHNNIELDYYSNIIGHYNSQNDIIFLKNNDEELETDFSTLLDHIPELNSNVFYNSQSIFQLTSACSGYTSKLMYRYNDNSINKNKIDSLYIASILGYTKDNHVLCELLLSKHFSVMLERFQISNFEKYQDIRDTYIKTSPLKESLENHYLKVKELVRNPQIPDNAKLSIANTAESEGVLKSLIGKDLNRVTYVDCWGTWCNACLKEFPFSKRIMEKYNSEDVSFVFLCCKSEPENWKRIISKYEIGGRHYFLNRKQSIELEKELGFRGYPFYVLLDNDGNIIGKGNRIEFGPGSRKLEELISKELKL